MNTQTTTEKQILENNQLIRQFMGLSPKLQSPDVYSYSDGIFYSVRGSIEECIEGMNKYVKYHTSWDWLMPVVEKIELMNKETGFMGTFTLFGQGRTKVKCYIKENLKHEIDILSERYGIAPTYKAVVEFIQWYNTEKAIKAEQESSPEMVYILYGRQARKELENNGAESLRDDELTDYSVGVYPSKVNPFVVLEEAEGLEEYVSITEEQFNILNK